MQSGQIGEEPFRCKLLKVCKRFVVGWHLYVSAMKAIKHDIVQRVIQFLFPNPNDLKTLKAITEPLFHEAAHSTGISKRLNRGLDDESPAPFGSPDYSKEELIAEMGAAFLNAAAQISPPTIEQSAAYIDNWQKILKGDKRLVVTAAGAAQKAADWILGSDFFAASESSSQPPNPVGNKPTETPLTPGK